MPGNYPPLAAAALICLAWCNVHARASEAARPENALAERVKLNDGRSYEGLIESENDNWLDFMEIHRPPGRPMYLVFRPIPHPAIVRIDRLAEPERARLRAEIEHLVHRVRIEAADMNALHLFVRQIDGDTYQCYSGEWFHLKSTTDEATTRRIIVRVEQAFAAYRQLLPPRCRRDRTLRVMIFSSEERYQAYLAKHGVHLKNQACFVSDKNVLMAGSDLARYQAELAEVTAAHVRLRAELEQLEKRLPERLQEFGRQMQASGLPKAEVGRLITLEKQKARQAIDDLQRQLQASERQNAREFDKVTAQMLTRLYHEAFHAYVEDYVYPHAQYDMPAWLQEGLAVMAEAGIVESGVLRIDAPHREALRQLQADLAGASPVKLADLLSARFDEFHVSEAGDAAAASHLYAAAWGLVYYLVTQRDLLSGPALDAYVQPDGQDAAAASPLRETHRNAAGPA